jgi:hypothetical protein
VEGDGKCGEGLLEGISAIRVLPEKEKRSLTSWTVQRWASTKAKISVLLVRVAVAGYDSTDLSSGSGWENLDAAKFEKLVGVA